MTDHGAHDKSVVRNWKDAIRLTFYGVLIGCADVFPGISGGAIAFILGIYEALINSIRSFNLNAFRSLFAGNFQHFSKLVAWKFLLSLLAGVATTFIVLTHLVQGVLYHEVYRTYLYATFSGLLVAAIYVCSQRVRHWKPLYAGMLLLGAGVAFFVSGLKPSQNVPNSYDVHLPNTPLDGHTVINYDTARQLLLNVPEPTLSAMLTKKVINGDTQVYSQQLQRSGPASTFVTGRTAWHIDMWLFTCGVIAISAMLSGLSGTYLLALLGVYSLAIGAIADFTGGLWHLSFDSHAFMIIVSLGLGVLCGAAAFSRVIHWLLAHYHDATLATLIGILIGGLRALWPFWTYEYILVPLKLQQGPRLQIVDPALPPLDSVHTWIAALCALIGFGAIWLLWKAIQGNNKK